MALTPQQYELVAVERYKDFIHKRNLATDGHVGYARWLLAALLAVNGGALVAISQLGEISGEAFKAGGFWFLAGLMSAIASGFCSWINLQLLAAGFDRWINPEMLFDPSKQPDGKIHRAKRIDFSLGCAIFFGVVSWSLVAVGAWRIYEVYAV
ncbi:hypothetical protein [Hoeflea sp. TYP-13]|uniref:hypothetical protein n=1 Tax=Hoeflea sp. TYP-13 TaxID=3230023 RepID=UPI0034C5E318